MPIKPCPCSGADSIMANCGSGSATNMSMPKPRATIPFGARDSGAIYQNARYGQGMRLHNIRVKDGKVVGITCTVCGTRKLA